MSTIFEIPNEVLVLILQHLENSDINNLLAIPSVRSLLNNFYCNVSDGDVRRFSNIPRICYGDPVAFKKINTFLEVIVEINSESKFPLPESAGQTLRISIFSPDDYMVIDGDATFEWLMTRSLASGNVRRVTFENIEKLSLRNHALDPRSCRFPHVKTIHLENIAVPETTEKFTWPSLEELTVVGTFRGIDSAIDYENANIKSLHLFDIYDVTEWRNVHCSSLETIEMDHTMFISMSGLAFENLIDFTIDSSPIFSFQKMTFPNLCRLVIYNAASSLTMRNVDAPALLRLSIYVDRIQCLTDLNMPCLIDGDIGQQEEELKLEGDVEIQTSIFSNIKSTKLVRSSEILRYSPELTSLHIDKPIFLRDHYNLPNLKKLKVSRDCKGQFDLFPTSLLTTVEVMELHDHCLIEDLEGLQENVPHLQTINLEDSVSPEISDICVEKIKALNISSRGTFHIDLEDFNKDYDISIKRCSFPDLLYFVAANRSIKRSPLDSTFNFVAPMLKFFVVKDLYVEHLDLSSFPLLVRVDATGGIRSVTLGSTNELRELDLSDNPELISLNHGELTVLESLKCTGSLQFFKTCDLNVPLLRKVMCHGDVRYEKRDDQLH